MSLPKKLIREMEKLRWEIKDSEHEHGRIFEMLVQPRLAERVNKSQELMIERRRSEVAGDEYFSMKITISNVTIPYHIGCRTYNIYTSIM